MLLPPPPQPLIAAEKSVGDSAIVDMRQKFARKTPDHEKDRAEARAFIDGKIDMIERDPTMTREQKSAAIADLKARR